MSESEYEHVECKQSLQETKAIVESVAAFATATGGTVRVGIRPDGSVIGTQLGRNSLENLANDIKLNTRPPQFPSIEVQGPDTAAVVSISVQESPVKPVWAYGRPFKRVGRTNQRLSPEETQRLMEITSGRTWDALPCRGLRVEDVDPGALRAFLRRSELDDGAGADAVLENLGLVTPEGPSNAAALLFTSHPQRFFPEAQVKCARFEGTSSVRFLDQQTLDGTVLLQAEQALAFVARNTSQGIRITGRPERETVPEYPLEAIREAVANAICHRDYAAPGTVQIRIYDDRLEVWNPGMLPSELTVEALYREHPSRPRNRRLALALYRARLIEQWGTGTLRIVQSCEARGMPRPEFVSEMGVFIVRFQPPPPAMPPPERVDREQRFSQALAFVREHGGISSSQYRDLVSVSRAQAKRDLQDLIQLRALVRQGSGASTRYVLPGR